ncbi:MAG: hypothetical protein ACRDRU_10345 [Pseudonocardiaceae bacterium]
MTRSDPGGQPPGSPAAAELAAVHAVTRWLVGAAASALAILLAGVRLSALGQLASDQPERLAVAVIACAVALLAAGITLVLAARVLVSPGWTLSKLAHLDAHHRWQSHPLQPALEAQRGLLTPDDDLQPGRLYRRHRRLYVAWFQLQERGCTTLPDDLYAEQNTTERDYSVANDQDVDRLRRRLEEATSISEGIAATANLVETRRRYRRLVRVMRISGIFVVVAVPVFAWATTVQPEPAVTTPIAIHLTFAHDRSVIQQAGLPPDCANRDVNAIAIGGSLLQPILVSTSDPHCILNQVRVTPALGTAVPALPPH